MANALACAKCGNTIASDRIKLEFDGNCPWCLAAFALGDAPQDESASTSLVPGAKASDRLGKYLLMEKLGTGGMGEVWKALDTELNRWVALKFLKDQDSKELARFAREAHMAAKLSHPNIAAVHEIGEVGGRHYIAMQCIEGRTLETFRTNDRRLLVRLCLDAAKALDHAHRHGVIHRDVKPGNLMVEETEEGTKVVVLDFGLARSIEGGEKLSMSGSVVGTPHYLSPEQARAEKLDERTDVYSLGATMYEIFTGRAAFEGGNVYDILKKVENEEPMAPRRIKPQINQDLQTIILKCLEKRRERRYDNAKELAHDLRRFLNHEAVLARPPSAIYLLKMRLSKRKSLVAAVAALLCLVVGAAVLLPKMIAESAARARIVEYQTPYTEGRNAWDEVLQIVQKAPLEHAARKAREARSHFEKAIGILELADAQVMRGKCLQLEGSPQEAEAAWERALVLDPGNQEARFHLAKMLLLRYYNAQAPALAHRDKSGGGFRIIETGPETPEETRLRARAEKLLAGVGAEEKSAYLRGVLEVNRRRYKEGAALLAQYNREGWDAASIALEGSARLYSGDYEGAIRVCTRAIELDPKNAHTYVLRGLAREGHGLHDAAIEDFNEALRLDPKNAGTWHSRGNSKSDQGKREDAIVDFNESIKLDPNSAVVYYSRG
ncbi:MAG TPA: protein kinase, partial [Planctomycetota bacterium]|nr:protein kinase [Planctomycetota bacterium]